MAHALILGMTESGKTTLAKQICRTLGLKGWGTLVLDPIRDPGWECSFLTIDLEEFIRVAKASRRCFLFVDEAGMNCHQWATESIWLATQSRHWGHSCFFIAQRLKLINTTIRAQCRYLYLFNCTRSDGRELADEWNKPQLANSAELERGEYFYCSRFGPVVKKRIFREGGRGWKNQSG